MNKEKVSLSQNVIDCSLNDYLFSQIDDMNAVAIEYFGTRIKYCQLKEHIENVAKALCAYGVKEGDVVTLCSVTVPEIIFLFYALDVVGAIPNMVDPRSSVTNIRGYLCETESRLVFCIGEACLKMKEAIHDTCVEKIITISPDDSMPPITGLLYRLKNGKAAYSLEMTERWAAFYEKGMKDTDTLNHVPYNKDRPCIMLHTGGTTGTSKCVLLSARNINASAAQYEKVGFGKNQTFLNVIPPFVAYGVTCGIHLPLSRQETCVVIPALITEELGGLLLKYKPNHIAVIPSYYIVLMKDRKLKGKDLSFLINTGCGGDAIAEGTEREVNEFLKNHGCRYPLCKGWGMTELSATGTTNVMSENKPGSVGFPLSMTKIAIINPETGDEVPAGTEGEIYVSSPTVMLGYFRNDSENEKIFVTRSDGEKWIKTGDIGMMDEDGYLFIRGRIKRVIIRPDGFKVFPVQIENVVSACPDVEECSVVGVRDEKQIQGKLPVVFMTRKTEISDASLIEKVKELCQEQLPEYCQPSEFYCLESLPHTPIGKTDYKALEERVETAGRPVSFS